MRLVDAQRLRLLALDPCLVVDVDCESTSSRSRITLAKEM